MYFLLFSFVRSMKDNSHNTIDLGKEVQANTMRPPTLLRQTASLPRARLLPAIAPIPARRYSTEQTSPVRQPRIPPPVRPTLAVSTEKKPNGVVEYAL